MKVTFYSNFLTHHQVPFCLEMQKRLGEDFKFVSTVKIFQWRLDLGFRDLDQDYDFVIRAYENQTEYQKAKELADESDIVIIGSTTDELIAKRLVDDKITFRYRSRIFMFPDGFWATILSREKQKLFYTRHLKYKNNRNLYLLCANGYGAMDFARLGLYRNKMYKWGYFLQTIPHDVEKLIAKKETNSPLQIVWAARFLKWKHPEVVVRLAEDLKNQGYQFIIKMLGQGKLEPTIRALIKEKNLGDVIEIVGQVDSDRVHTYMEVANIFLSTSDHNEGWGAVINESMNAACAIVADENMGSAPYLIKYGKTGLTYDSYAELLKNMKMLLDNQTLRESLGENAYNFITKEWNVEIAADNLLKLFKSILGGKEIEIKNGPVSPALPR